MVKSDNIKFRTPYDGSVLKSVVDCSVEPSMTKQSFKAECDINNIMAKYYKTGLIDHVVNAQVKYADVSKVVDYQTALNTVMEAEDSFMSLPSQIRAKFENDPTKFFDFVNNPSNLDEMVNLGLAERKPAPDPIDAIQKAGEIGTGEPTV